MNYNEITFSIQPFSETQTDVLSALLGPLGFESFVVEGESLKAYIQENLYDEAALEAILADYPLEAEIRFSKGMIEQKNWNEEWEKNYFQPIILENRCVIHSTFHQDIPAADFDILIDPKMAFGTGHHETTSQMLTEILDFDCSGKDVLDMGCGTAVLGILTAKKGAKSVRAIDIDDWVCDNANENVVLNEVDFVEVQCGDASLLEDGRTYDMILANINRNILLADLARYAATMRQGASIFMSGFYVEDIPAIRAEAEKQGLTFDHFREKNRWVAIQFIKK